MADNEKKQKTISKRQSTLKKEFLTYLQENGIIMVACRKSGVPRQNIYRWISEDSKFSKEVNRALRRGREVGVDMAESVIIGKITEKDIGAAKFYLSHNDPRYMSPAKNTEQRAQQRASQPQELEFVPLNPQTFNEKQVVLGQEYEEKLRNLIIEERRASQ